MGQHPGQAGRNLRPEFDYGGDVTGAIACLLLDVERWPAADDVQQSTSAVPHALSLVDLRGHIRRILRGIDPDLDPGRTGQHRYAAGIRHRLRRSMGAAGQEPGPTTSIQDAMGAV